MFSVRSCVLLLRVALVIGGNVHPGFKKLRIPEEAARNIYDYINGADDNLTEECSQALNRYADSLLSEELWALRMFDSGSKHPAGIIPGEETNMGNFDECLSSENSTSGERAIYGMYCFGDLEILSDIHGVQTFNYNNTRTEDGSTISVPIEIATCFPHACSATDIQGLYSSFGFKYNISETNCQSKDSKIELDTLGIIGITLLGSIVSLMILSTVYDVCNHCREIKPPRQLLTAFSVLTNFKKLLETSDNPNQISCFHGLRVFSVMMIILIHRQGALHSVAFHSVSGEKFDDRFTDLFLISIRTAVDTFFMMSGFLVSYGFMAASAKGVKFNIFSHWFHRYLRLTPPLAAILLMSVSLVKHLGSGPRWLMLMQRDLENPCKNYWWSSLLYVQNYINPENICLVPTWYLSVDTQLFFLSPMLLLLFFKYPYLKSLILGGLIVGLPFIPLYVSWSEQHRIFNDYHGDPVVWNNFFSKIYFPTHARAPSWLIGFATGYIIYTTKQSKFDVSVTRKVRKLTIAVFLIVIIAIIFFCVFGVPLVVISIGYSRVFDSVFLAFGELVWAVAVSCLVAACVHGYAGPINWILSNHLMQILSKLSYSMYLLHYVVLFFDTYRTRTVPVFESFDFAYTFWSDYMVSMFLAVFWVLAFEFPLVTLTQLIWPRNKRK